MFLLILTQTLTLAFRKGGGAFGSMAFYIMIITLFTFALGPEALHMHAGAVMMVGLLLAGITSLPLLYERDYEDGTLEQFLLQPVLLELVVMAKIMGQWLANIFPLLLLSPLLAMMAGLNADSTIDIMTLLLLASPTLVAIGSVAAALTLGTRRGGLLQALVILPFYMPVLIFAASNAGQGALWLLAGMACASIPFACIATAALIRMSTD